MKHSNSPCCFVNKNRYIGTCSGGAGFSSTPATEPGTSGTGTDLAPPEQVPCNPYNGAVLIELLIASLLFSLAGSSVYMGFMQGVKARQRIHESFRAYDPLRSAFFCFERDLRNAVRLRGDPFIGKAGEMIFPVLLAESLPEGKIERQLLRIRYVLKNRNLVRVQEKLTPDFVKSKPAERIVLKEVASFSLTYPYRDDEDRLCYEKFWLEEPYQGIPRGVRIDLAVAAKEGECLLSKIISIPQGEFGRLAKTDGSVQSGGGVDDGLYHQ